MRIGLSTLGRPKTIRPFAGGGNAWRGTYRRENVMQGARHACYKLPYNSQRLEALVDAIEEDLFREYEREVTSDEIGRVAHRVGMGS